MANCRISFYLDGISNYLTDISPSFVKTGQDTFGDFVIKNWRIGHKKDDKHGKMIEISMTLTRDITRIFMITFLPTILMNLVNQASNYITGQDKYSMIYAINITSMMVLASIYLSVSSSLPNTGTINPMEVWVLVNLSYPLLVILTNVILQVCPSQSTILNAHFNPVRQLRTKYHAESKYPSSHIHIHLLPLH